MRCVNILSVQFTQTVKRVCFPGPLPRDVPYRVLASPRPSPPASPARSVSDDDTSFLSLSEGRLTTLCLFIVVDAMPHCPSFHHEVWEGVC